MADGEEHRDLSSILSSDGRDFLIRNNGDQVKITDLTSKVVGLYFSASWCGPCRKFTPKLVEAYGELASKGENFEVVFVSSDEDEGSFTDYFSKMPWLAIPFSDSNTREHLDELFSVRGIPHLVILDGTGKVLNDDGVPAVGEYGVEAYPFSPEKLEQLAEKEKAKLEAQTLESLLVSGERDFVIGKGGLKVPVSELVGKNILLYFSAQWCPPCRAFLPKLIDSYHKIKSKDSAFEVVFISSDQVQNSFNDFFAEMPWLALPFGDERKKYLSRTFKIVGIPALVAIDPTGKTVTKEARDLVMAHGSDAYPFTEKRMKELEAKMEEMAKNWPEKVKHELHEEHELVRTRRRGYVCDRCEDGGNGWSFYCDECDFDLHPKCALNDDGNEMNEEQADTTGKEGFVCDGDVCYKA